MGKTTVAGESFGTYLDKDWEGPGPQISGKLLGCFWKGGV